MVFSLGAVSCPHRHRAARLLGVAGVGDLADQRLERGDARDTLWRSGATVNTSINVMTSSSAEIVV